MNYEVVFATAVTQHGQTKRARERKRRARNKNGDLLDPPYHTNNTTATDPERVSKVVDSHVDRATLDPVVVAESGVIRNIKVTSARTAWRTASIERQA